MGHDVVRPLSVRKEAQAGPDVCPADVEMGEGGTGSGDEDWMTTAHVTTREFGLGFSFLSSQTTRPSSFSTQLTQEQHAFCGCPVDMPN